MCTGINNGSEAVQNLSKEEKILLVMAPAVNRNSLGQNKSELQEYTNFVMYDSLSYSSAQSMKNDLQSVGGQSKFPSSWGIDAEGGPVQRFAWYKMANLRQSSSLSDEQLAARLKEQAAVMKSAGINWTLAPVVDYTSNKSHWIYSRTPANTVEGVVDLSTKYLNVMNENDIMTTLKHYPGHGQTSLDSHKVVPEINQSKEDWQAGDGKIYSQLAPNAAMVMVGHLKFNKIDDKPASSSSVWMIDVLRTELGFKGIVVTDDLGMLQPKNTSECAKNAVDSLNSGADILLFVHSNVCNTAGIKAELSSSADLDIMRLDESAARVLDGKKKQFCN